MTIRQIPWRHSSLNLLWARLWALPFRPMATSQRLAEICRDHDVLLIADEIMSGMGRTGRPFAMDHWGMEPDMITVGKGVASGYAPLGAVIVGPRVVQALTGGSGAFQHGFTYQNHPVSMAAGNAVLDVLEEKNLFARVGEAGRELFAALEPLKAHRHVGDVRGLGLLAGIEFVKDKATRPHFRPKQTLPERSFSRPWSRACSPIRRKAAWTA